MDFIHLLNSSIDNKPVVVESVINEDWDYTGNYRAIIDGSTITEVSIDDNAQWFEKAKGYTPLARQLGELIEGYFE